MTLETANVDGPAHDGLIQGMAIDDHRDVQSRDATSHQRTWKDKEYRGKIIRSLCTATGLFCLGASEAQSGPTFLDIQIITSTGPKTASVFFTVHSVGYLAGCVLAGFLSKKFRRTFLIFINLLAMGATTIITPYCSHLASMIAAKIIGGVFAGIVDTYINADHMKTWGHQGQALMQLLHFMFALGGLLSPLISAPFLAPRENLTNFDTMDPYHDNGNTMTDYGNNTGFTALRAAVTEGNYSNAGSYKIHSLASGMIDQRRETRVHYAFLIIGLVTFVSSIPFFIIFIRELRNITKTNEESKTNAVEVKEYPISYRQIPRRLHCFLVVLLSSFFLFYCGIEDTFCSLLMTFLVKKYDDVKKSEGAYILAIFWTCFASSRFIMIFLARRFSALKLLTSSVILMSLSFVTFTLVAEVGEVIFVAIVTGLVGLSMSGIFAFGFSWSESEYIRVTSSVSASILIFSTIGVMINPLLMVFMMEQRGSMWFCYLFVAELVILVSVFAVLILFNRKYLNRRYGPLRSYDFNVNCREEKPETVFMSHPENTVNGEVLHKSSLMS